MDCVESNVPLEGLRGCIYHGCVRKAFITFAMHQCFLSHTLSLPETLRSCGIGSNLTPSLAKALTFKSAFTGKCKGVREIRSPFRSLSCPPERARL